MADDPQPSLAPRDRDAMIRTMLTEAASNDPQGWAAVGSVVRNRMAQGQYAGMNPAQVVMAPGQFEVWQNGRAQGVDPQSPQYEQAGRIADAIASGLPDPTNGATHFYSPAGQQALGRNAPAWGKGQPLASMGGHLFFAPQGAVTFGGDAGSAIDKATEAKTTVAGSDDVFKRWGVGGDAKPAAMPDKATDTGADSVFSRWGVGAAGADKSAPVASPAPTKTPDDPYLKGGDESAAFGRGLIEGVPIAGPYMLGGLERVAAGVRTLQNGTTFPEELAKVRQFGAATAANNPGFTTAGNVGGAVLGTGALAAAAPTAMGVQGAGFLSRSTAGALSGAGIGASDAYVRGENPLVGAGFGLAGGGLGPAIGELAAGGANRLTQGVRNMLPTGDPNMGRGAANMLTQIVGADDPAAVKSFLTQHGPMAMIADSGPSSLGLTQALATKPGEAKTAVVNALTNRASGSSDRIENQLTRSLGPAEDPQVVTNSIRDLRSAQDAAYQGVHANAPDVDASAVVKLIDARLETATGAQKTALQKVRGELVDKAATDTTPEVLTTSSEKLHNLRKDMDAVINYGAPGLGVEQGAVRGNQGTLKSVRGELDDVLKSQVPGMADADAASATLAQRQAAVQRGYSDVLGAKGPAPQTFAAARDNMAPGEAIAENKGIRGRVDRMFGSGTQRDAVTLNKLLAGGEDGYNAANLRTAFGEPQTNALLDTLGREKTFNRTTDAVVNNSMTAQRQAGVKMLEDSQPGSLNVTGMNATGLALQAAKSAVLNPIMKMIMESPNASRNMQLANAMVAQGATRDQIMDTIMRLNRGNALQSSTMAAIARGGNLLTMGAGSRYRPNNLLVSQ